MEGGIREVGKIVMQDVQEPHCQRNAASRKDGSIHQIRWPHARKLTCIFFSFLFPSIFLTLVQCKCSFSYAIAFHTFLLFFTCKNNPAVGFDFFFLSSQYTVF